MSRSIIVRPPAKLNLILRVGARRPDGYHDVRTLLQSVALSDTLTVSERRGPFVLQTRAPGVPSDDTNLVWRAARALWQAAGQAGEPRNAHVKLDKQVPIAAGLGGGSADAAGALVALNTLWDTRVSRRDLFRLAASLGADVPFFLLGGTAIGTGRGDEIYPVDDFARLGVVIVKPSFGVATPDAYRWFDEAAAAATPVADPAGAGEAGDRRRVVVRDVDSGWATGPIVPVNDLQGPVAAHHPEIDEMVAACIREGALAAAMTGSGSAVYGLFPEAVARRAVRRLQRPDWLVILTR
ncbi:MAG: 4-(cytidine 5'-diphospho)-2-C-methyl-D-erythritol kinase [Vicinamibacterales bacterium]